MALSKHVREPGEPVLYKSDRIRIEGRVEGKVELLIRLLTKRFGALPPEITARLRNGTPSDIGVRRVEE